MNVLARWTTHSFIVTLLLSSTVGSAWAQDRTEPLPPELKNVGITEKLDQQLPLGLAFKDHTGKPVKLGDYFDGEKPVILTLNYYKCPMLCGLTLNGMVDALQEIDWRCGDKFRIVTVSFDPMETPTLANLKRQNYLEYYGERGAGSGWQFLTGPKASIDPLLEKTGFRIAWNKDRQEWMHAAALIVCTPDGRISRYLYGVAFEPKTVRLSLVEASEGKIGSPMDQILLFCYHFEDGEYTLAAFNIMRAGGVLTMLIIGGLLLVLWRRERRPRPVESEAATG